MAISRFLSRLAGFLDSTGKLTQTGLAANVAGNGPAFSAYPLASQSIASNTWTKLQVNTELFDTNSNYDSTTNYRFTPTVAGYYQVTGAWYANTSGGQVVSGVYKNGVVYQTVASQFFTSGVISSVTALVYLNGSTDYVEFYVYQGQGPAFSTLAGRPDLNYFQAFLARAA
jgi:hypothetical protein